MSGWIKNRKLFSRVTDVAEGKVKEEKETRPDDTFFYSTCAPIRVMSQLQGCYPFTRTRKGIVFSPVLSFYSVVALLGAVAVGIWDADLPSASGSYIEWIKFLDIASLYCAVVATVVCMLFTMPHVKTVHRALLNMAIYFTHQQLHTLYRKQVLMISFGYLLVTSYYLAVLFMTPEYQDITGILVSMTGWFLEMAMIVFRLQFFFVIAYLRVIISNLCTDIGSLTSQQTNRVPAMIILYERVCVVAETTMKGFGMAVGVSTAMVTADCLTTAYYVTSEGDDDDRSSVFSTWLLIELWQQWLLLTATEMHSWQCSRVPIAVHTAMNMIQDSPVNDQLRQFSVYLLHRRLRFTICGVVPLNYSLLFTIAGGVTTYMLVLLQFKRSGSPDSQCPVV